MAIPPVAGISNDTLAASASTTARRVRALQTAASEETSPGAESTALARDAQEKLVQRRIAGDSVAAFKTVAVDQTYSAAATAMYLSAAVYRAQADRPKAADAELPGPVQPVKSVDSIAALGDFGVGDSTAKTR